MAGRPAGGHVEGLPPADVLSLLRALYAKCGFSWDRVKAVLGMLVAPDRGVREGRVECIYCGRRDTIRYGKVGLRQVYLCRSCGRRFVLPRAGRVPEEVKRRAVELVEGGMSVRRAAEAVREELGVEVSPSAVWRWWRAAGGWRRA